MTTETSLDVALDRLNIDDATTGRQIEVRDGKPAPGAPGPAKPIKSDTIIMFEHDSQDMAKHLNQEVRERDYVLKDIKMPKTYNCDRCAVICTPRRCGKCQRAVYCSSECQRAAWPKHKGLCKSLAHSISPTERNFEKATLKLATRMLGDHDFTEQIASIIVAVLSLHYHPERGRTHRVTFDWDLVPLRTPEEYRQNLPAKGRVDGHGKQRFMLQLVRAEAEAIAEHSLVGRKLIENRREDYLKQNRARLRSQGAPEDAMDDCHHIPFFFRYSKIDRDPRASIFFTTMNPGIVAFKYAAVLGDMVKLIELSGKEVDENDYIRYAVRLMNSQIVTSQMGRNFRTSISLDEAADEDD
ncbi:unnamed protein product [Peniophora sp. CBMAI 1063]|nr:unnamed protein product [Peniophora sp. CBMAI 1063]